MAKSNFTTNRFSGNFLTFYGKIFPHKKKQFAVVNVFDLLPFNYEGTDLRMNPFKERGSDAYGHTDTRSNSNPLNYNGGTIIRS